MAKLKFGAIADDKPVKLTIRIARGGTSRSYRLCRSARRETGQPSSRAGQADRADAGALHGHRSCVWESKKTGCFKEGRVTSIHRA